MSANETDRLATVKWMTVKGGEVDKSVEPVLSVDSFFDIEPLHRQMGDLWVLTVFSIRERERERERERKREMNM